MTEDQVSADSQDSAFDSPSALTLWSDLVQRKDAAESEYEAAIAPHKEAFDSTVTEINSQLADLEKAFLANSEETGQDTYSGDSGNVKITTRESPKIADSDAFNEWVVSANRVDLLQKRISVTQYREFKKDNPDTEVPGLVVEIDRQAKFKPQT